MQAGVATPRVNVEAYLLACVLSLTNTFCGPENVCERERFTNRTLFPLNYSKARLYGAVLFESVPLSPHGFQFHPPQHISNAIASYCNLLQANWKIPRCESKFVLALDVQAGYLHSFSWFPCMARAPSAFVRGVVIVTKSSENSVEEKEI